MRNFKSFTLIAALALGNFAFAATPSTSDDYNNATASGLSTNVGSFGDAVSFEVSASTFVLPTDTLVPDAIYTLTIPVANPTNRDITLTFNNVTISGSATIVETSDPILVPAGDTTKTMTIKVKINGVDEITTSTPVAVSYTVKGSSVDY